MTIEIKLSEFINNYELKYENIPILEAYKANMRHDNSSIGHLYCELHTLSTGNSFLSNADKFFIGRGSYINEGGYLRGKTFIGRYCSIGRRVSVAAGMHSYLGLSTSPFVGGAKSKWYSTSETLDLFGKEPSGRPKFTIIQNDVWIGDGAVILEGSTVGTGAIIAANSVVTKNVNPYEVVGGSPAKVIRKRFPEKIIEKLLATQWWNFDTKFLQSCPTSNVLLFIEYCQDTKKENGNEKTRLIIV
jgi:acetyltransferase-like isoleucine patch superfamily enzyme